MRSSRRRTIPLPLHAGIEAIAAAAIMASPFLLGLDAGPTAVAVGLGVMLFALSVEAVAPTRSIPLSAHQGFDYVLALVATAAGIAVGIASGDLVATVFLVGVGAVLATLTAVTRFSVPRGA